VARGLAPQELTMQAVAAALGVDRKALHRHVGDRDGLVELVVADIFESQLARVDLPADAEWPALLHAYATALRDGVVQLGAIRARLWLSGGVQSTLLPWAERVLDALVGAHFTVHEAGGILTLVAGVAIAAGQNATLMTGTRVHPHLPEVARALQNREHEDLPLLSQVIAARKAEPAAEPDFEFDLRVITAGLQTLLAARASDTL
jgi:TetR/AcrR family transcriptional regulator, tetracycline repressor protein